MGREADCIAHFSWVAGGKAFEGRAMLEADELLFKGPPRVVIARAAIVRVAAADGELVVTVPEGTARFDLDAAAEKWREAIASPPTLMDKLGVKKEMQVALVADAPWPDAFRAELAAKTANVREGAPVAATELVIAQVLTPDALAAAAKLAAKTKVPLWIIYPKGKDSPVPEASVFEAIRGAGLKDNKTCRFDETLTGLRFVVPKAK